MYLRMFKGIKGRAKKTKEIVKLLLLKYIKAIYQTIFWIDIYLQVFKKLYTINSEWNGTFNQEFLRSVGNQHSPHFLM